MCRWQAVVRDESLACAPAHQLPGKVVASLGVEPRWASPVDFESTASTSSATRPQPRTIPEPMARKPLPDSNENR
jgi:hypothetical protein